MATEKNRDGYTPLFDAFDIFYSRYLYRRVRDCFNRPICSTPTDIVEIKDRITHDFGWTFEFSGTKTNCINLGSYNYLGFAQNKGACAKASSKAIKKFGLATCSPRRELGERKLTEQ
jgi:serine palmitoyltransferase